MITISDQTYSQWINQLSSRYRKSQIKAAIKVNREMLIFYWSLGRDIVNMKAEQQWGTKFLQNLSKDLKFAMPDATCFSETNLKYMKYFYEMYEDFCPQLEDNSIASLIEHYTEHGRRGKTQQVGAGHPFVRHKKRRRPEQHGGSGHTESRHHQRAHDAGCQDKFCHRSHQPPHHAGAETGSVALHFVYIHIGITRPTPENCPMTRPTRPTHSIFNFNFLVKIRGFYKFAGTVKMLCIHCIIFNNF